MSKAMTKEEFVNRWLADKKRKAIRKEKEVSNYKYDMVERLRRRRIMDLKK